MSTASIFDNYSGRYDSWFDRNRVIAEAEARLVEMMVDKRPILEVGVGTGFFASRVRAEAGLDPSLGMLSIARRRLRGSLLVLGVGEKLPFRSSIFGAVVVVVTLCFVDDPEALLREAWRVLRPGGELVSCIVPLDSSWGRFYVEKGKKGHPLYSKARFLSRSSHVNLIESAGFSVVRELGVLSFKPWDEPRLEDPAPWNGDMGFVCAKALKTLDRH